jgi:hypothetical protein
MQTNVHEFGDCPSACARPVATFITLLMVPVLYSIAILDLKILAWDIKPETEVGPAKALSAAESMHAG